MSNVARLRCTATLSAFAVAVIVFTPLPAASRTAPAADAGRAPYVVVLRPGTDAAAVAAEHAAAHGIEIDLVYRSAVTGYAARLTPAARAALGADQRVAFVERDRPVRMAAQSVPVGVDRVDADVSAAAAIDHADQPRTDVDVAVLDTGIDGQHPDLNVVGGADCAPGRGPDDRFGHGTHIAGTIAALDNGIGVVGVAPGARLWAVRVLDTRGEGTTSELLCGVEWVTGTRTDSDPANDIEVANLSLGGLGGDDGRCGIAVDDALHQAICRSVAAGVTYVVAAGNDGRDSREYSPASYREVITVSALADSDGRPGGDGSGPKCRPDERDDRLASFSNHGADVDLVAPGVCIFSTLPVDGGSVGGSGGYGNLTGTSFAAPHVAGAAALLLSGRPGLTPGEVRDELVRRGTLDWNGQDDPDGHQEPLVNVGAL